MGTITIATLRRLARQKRREDVSHSGVKGLWARGQTSGRVLWAGRTVPPGKTAAKWFSLGEWSEQGGMGLADATAVWCEMRDRIKRGEDPVAEKKAAPTVSEAIDRFMDRHVRRTLSAATAREYSRVLVREFGSAYGCLKLQAVERRHIAEFVDGVLQRCEAAGRRGTAANRSLAYLSKFFNWCVERGLLEHSPAAKVRKLVPERPRERVLGIEEARAVFGAVEMTAHAVHRGFLTAMLFTGQRRGEVASMRWDDVDLANRVWTLPGDATKNGKAHLVPLTDHVVAAIRVLPRFEGSPWVFTTTGKAHISGFSKLKSALDGLCPNVPAWNLHALRATLSTHLEGAGVPLEVISRILNHTPQGVTKKHYALHAYEVEKRAALERWAEMVSQLPSVERAAA